MLSRDKGGPCQLPINNEAAPPLPPTAFYLGVPRLYPRLVVPIAKKLHFLRTRAESHFSYANWVDIWRSCLSS